MKIYLICSLQLKELPPVLSVIQCLKDLGHDVTLLSPGVEEEYVQVFDSQNIKWHYLYSQKEWNAISAGNIWKRNKVMFGEWNRFVFQVLDGIDKQKDLVWILHEETAAKLSTKICQYKYIFSVYELRRDIKLLGKLPSNYIPIAKNACLVITPEYNRSNIMATWLDLNQIPKVIPNKPYVQPSFDLDDKEVDNRKAILREKLGDKKMVLYQGAFGPDRNLKPFIEAVRKFDDLKVVLMGKENNYLCSLLDLYGDDIIYLPGLSAPMHLKITEMAYIGIVSYKNDTQSVYDPLNSVYCAPNKIFEYSGFSVPMICTQQPGLHYTVEANHAGICVDCNEVENIQGALEEIMRKYEHYKEGAGQLYHSVNIPELIKEIVELAKKIDN